MILFSHVLRWGEAQCAKAPDSTSLRLVCAQPLLNLSVALQVLADVIPHIRFPLMSIQDVSSIVVPTHLLTADEAVALFTHIATKGTVTPALTPNESGGAVGVRKFNATPRHWARPKQQEPEESARRGIRKTTRAKRTKFIA